MRLWRTFFSKAKIFSCDTNKSNCEKFKIKDIKVFNSNGYSKEFVNKFDDNFFDYVINDGSHTIDAHACTLHYYYPKLKNKGKIILENIQEYDEIGFLELLIRSYKLSYTWKIIDMRKKDKRFDSVLFIATKNLETQSQF